GFPAKAFDDPQGELDLPIVAGMCEAHEWSARFDRHAELLMKLPCERLRLRFARGDLAARELPASGHVFAGRPLGDQHPTFTVIQRRRDDQNPSTLDNAPWQCLYFFPDPQGQGSLRPILRSPRTKVPCASAGGGSG